MWLVGVISLHSFKTLNVPLFPVNITAFILSAEPISVVQMSATFFFETKFRLQLIYASTSYVAVCLKFVRSTNHALIKQQFAPQSEIFDTWN